MKKLSYLVASLALITASFSAFAAVTPQNSVAVTNASAPASKVGVLDMRQVMEKSVQIAQIREKLQKDFKPKQDKLLSAQNTLKSDSERLRRDNAIMNNNDRKQLEQKLITGQQELQRMQANFQQELMAAQNKELKGFLDNVKNIVEKTAKNENLSLVITKDTVAFVNPDLDITNKVIQQLPHK
ncbi:MAG: OmpH family outer membrane protein [Gammaproteobacteria bacterium]|nr:OmpH family outer membrane protein [Gammaproteobacteria bacterium]